MLSVKNNDPIFDTTISYMDNTTTVNIDNIDNIIQIV